LAFFRRRKSAEAEQKALSGSADVISGIRDGWSAFPLLGSGSRERIQNIYNVAQGASYGWMYSRSPAVRTVIDMIVRSMGELDLRLFEEVAEDEWQPKPDHPAMLSLRYPNETTTMDGFVRSMVKDFLIHDNAYALLTPAAGNQFSISRIPAHMVVVQGDSLFDIELYRVWPQGAWTTAGAWGGGGTPIDLLPSQVLHWHGEHPHDPRVGLSRLDTLRDVIAEDAALSQAIIELANNGLQAPIWVSRPLDAPEMSHPTLKAHEEDIANRLKGRNRKPPVMVEGEKLESFGTSPQDAQMMEVRKWAVERVSMMYGVPPGLALQDRWASEARLQLIEDVLAPTGKDFTSVFDQRILVRVYDWEQGRFAFNLDEKRMSDDRLAKLVSATGRPVLLTNEARAMVNKPPVPGGDELITPLNVIEGDNPRPSPQVMPVQDANKPAQDGSYRPEDGPTPLPSGGAPSATNARPAANAPAARSAPPAKALKDYSPDERRDDHGRWIASAGFRNVEEAKAELAVRREWPQYADKTYQELLALRDRVGQQLERAKKDGRDTEKWQRRYDALTALKKGRQEAATHQRTQAALDEGRRTGKLTITDDEMRHILARPGDAYRDAGLLRPGEPKPGYTPEVFKTSDLSGQGVRHYVTLPDGRIAHPDEFHEARKRGRIIVVGQMPRPKDEKPFRSDLLPSHVRAALESGKALTSGFKSGPPAERLPQFHPRRGADIERQYRHIDTMSAVVQRHYTRLQRHLADREKKAKTGTDWPRWDREFADDINTALTSVVQGEGDVYSMKLGAPHSFDMGRVRNYLKAMAEGAAGAINDTIRGDIDALGLDDAFARAAQHVASAGASLGVRSTVWAREEAARQSPGYDTRVKSWIADTDRHAEFDGETVPIGADWPAGFPPGGVSGCKCSASVS
jgi:HK97 family phage portal protein